MRFGHNQKSKVTEHFVKSHETITSNWNNTKVSKYDKIGEAMKTVKREDMNSGIGSSTVDERDDKKLKLDEKLKSLSDNVLVTYCSRMSTKYLKTTDPL